MKKRINKYYVYGDIVLVECYDVAGNISRYFICDADDIDIVEKYPWRIVPKHNGDYVVTGNQRYEKKYFHELVIERQDNCEIDHINRDTLDCRKCNLRNATSSEQKANQKINKRNTSKFRGVSFSKSKRGWIVDFRWKNVRLYFPVFYDLEEAVYVRYCMEVELFGNYRNKNNDVRINAEIEKISSKRKQELDNIIYKKIAEYYAIASNKESYSNESIKVYKIDSEGNIVPKRNRVTYSNENKNSRKIQYVEIDDKLFCMSDACKLLNINYSLLQRYKAHNKGFELADIIKNYAEQKDIDLSNHRISNPNLNSN